jgi:hypothetical protein
MLFVIAFALAVGLLGSWVYAGCPLPRKLAAARKPTVADGAVSLPPAPGALTAQP